MVKISFMRRSKPRQHKALSRRALLQFGSADCILPIGLTARDREICDAIGPLLREKGQIFVGIDVIGDFLTEINVTSPTGIQELERFDGTNVAGLIWDAIAARLSG